MVKIDSGKTWDNWKVFILPRVAEWLNHKEKQRGCSLLDANKHTHIYYLFAWDYHQSFLIINIIFHEIRNEWILKIVVVTQPTILRNYSLKQINNIYIYIHYIYLMIYVCLFASSRGQPLCFSLRKTWDIAKQNF